MANFHHAAITFDLCFPANKFDLARLKKSGVSLVVDCIAQQQESGEQCSLGHAVLSLTSLDPGIKVFLFSLYSIEQQYCYL